MIIYVWKGDNRSYGFSPELWGGDTVMVEVDSDFVGGLATYDSESEKWIPDAPYISTHADDVTEAKSRLHDLIAEAEKIMAGWILDLSLGLISDEDKQKLIAWRLYVKALDALELDAAPDIEWPPRPEN